MTPLIVNTGEPAGIGPEVCLRAARNHPGMVLVGDRSLLQATAQQLSLPFQWRDWSAGQPVSANQPNLIHVLHQPLNTACTAGQLNPQNGDYVIRCLETAADLAATGQAAALVTAPVHKGIINDAGISFTGHTEFLAARAGLDKVVMMLATHGLRVALVTTHLPLAKVPAAITEQALAETLGIVQRSLVKQFAIEQPRIAVLGLNPHAGEGGHLGSEELEVIIPTLDALRAQGMAITGPLPADTAFNPEVLENHDVVVAQYHDQGLPVLKFKGFNRAVNVTLGLPYLRTSVDHGTAVDIAGQGIASSASLEYTIRFTQNLLENSQ